jgi:hypothetical protein
MCLGLMITFGAPRPRVVDPLPLFRVPDLQAETERHHATRQPPRPGCEPGCAGDDLVGGVRSPERAEAAPGEAGGVGRAVARFGHDHPAADEVFSDLA